MKIQKITNKIITFDFDGTLEDHFDGTKNKQKEEIQDVCKQLIDLGNDVRILTKRYSSEFHNLGIGKEHESVYNLANKLNIPLSNVHFTNRSMKSESIIKMGVNIHFEDEKEEVDLINDECHKNNHICLAIPVKDHYWRDLIY